MNLQLLGNGHLDGGAVWAVCGLSGSQDAGDGKQATKQAGNRWSKESEARGDGLFVRLVE